MPETIPGSTVSVVVSSSHCVTSHHGLVVARVLDSLAKRARKRSVGKLQGGNPSDGPDQSCMLHDVSEGGLWQLGYVIQVPVGVLAPPVCLDTDCLSQRQKKRQMRRLRRSYCRTRFPEDQRNHLSLVTSATAQMAGEAAEHRARQARPLVATDYGLRIGPECSWIHVACGSYFWLHVW